MTSRTRLVVLLVSAPVIAFVVIGGFLGRAVAREDSYGHLRIFEDVVSLIIDNYVETVDIDRVMEGAMRGLSDGLDPDSAYLTVDQVRELDSRLPEGRVGLQLTRQYYLRVIAARDGSPAADAGLRPGDYIRSIEGQPTRTMSVFEGTRLLRGTSGSTLALTILRGNSTEPTELELVREPIGGRLRSVGGSCPRGSAMFASQHSVPTSQRRSPRRSGNWRAREHGSWSSTSARPPRERSTPASMPRGCSSPPARSSCAKSRQVHAKRSGRAAAMGRCASRSSCSSTAARRAPRSSLRPG